MRMPVGETLMNMKMAMRRRYRIAWPMGVLMVLVVQMQMFVSHGFMNMRMLMALG